MTAPRRILFVGTGNSVRSQIAEGWFRHLTADRRGFQVRSAGVDPRHLHPLATAVMHEIGIDIGSQRGQGVISLRDERFDLVVTVCEVADAALGEEYGLRATRRLHRPIDDPTLLEDPDEPDVEPFRECRDEIRAMVDELLADF